MRIFKYNPILGRFVRIQWHKSWNAKPLKDIRRMTRDEIDKIMRGKK